jgi:hypothetical protein
LTPDRPHLDRRKGRPGNRLADLLKVDLLDAAHAKLDENERRYDPRLYRGSARKAPPLTP